MIENAEGFNIGPATGVGAVAALIILLLTFGTLSAAGMPLITAGLGLITGLALVGLATHVTNMSNVAPELAIMIGLGVGVDYALFIVTRFKENYGRTGDIEKSITQAMDTSGRAILLAGTTVVIALLGMFATGVSFMYGLAIASVLAVILVMTASLTVLPSLLSRIWGHRVVRPSRWARRREARGEAPRESTWRRWSLIVQARPWPLAIASLAGDAGLPAARAGVAPGVQRRRQRPVRHEHATAPSTCSLTALAPGSTARWRSSLSSTTHPSRRSSPRCVRRSRARPVSWP